MLLLNILLATSWIWFPLLVIFVVLHFTKKNTPPPQQSNTSRDQEWINYLISFRGRLKTKSEQQLLEFFLQGRSADELYKSPIAVPPVTNAETTAPQTAAYTQPPAYQQEAVPTAYAPVVVKKSEPIDNTLLLLYFGAFLLVASVGLFVGISGLDGVARTIIVALTAVVLYGGGLWLYGVSKKLAQAGVSFVGTGMIIAPLTGVAWYNLVSEQTNAGFVWLVTSLVCIGLYAYAYVRIKNDFISYFLIGSFVSTIESTVLTIDLPAYGYTWGLIVAGLALMFVGRIRPPATNAQSSLDLQRASSASSQLLIPLSIIGSLTLLPEFGSVQLAITLSLSGLYYSLLAWWQPENRTNFSVTAQVSYITALSSLVYALNDSILETGLALIVVVGVYALGILAISNEHTHEHSLVSVASIASISSILLCMGDGWSLVSAVSAGVILATVVWYRLESTSALQLGGGLLLSLPFVIGPYALELEVATSTQLLLCGIITGLFGLLTVASSKYTSCVRYYPSAAVLYLISVVLLGIPATALGFNWLLGATLAVMASFIGLRIIAKDVNWLVCSGIVALTPLIYSLMAYGIDDARFSATVGLALVWNIGLSLITRQATVRWIVVSCMLIAPFAVGGGGLGLHWASAGYAGGFMLSMISCVLARAIARGKLLLSAKVPISGYYAEASEAFVVGYVLSGILAVIISLNDSASHMVTTLILAAIGLLIVLISKIERNLQLLSLLPVIVQCTLFSALRPDVEDSMALGITAVTSTLCAVATYAIATLVFDTHKTENSLSTARSLRVVSLFTAYIGPTLVLFSQEGVSLLLPASLLAAGLLTLEYNRQSEKQSEKEFSIAVSIAAIHWFVYLIGFTNIHVHTHLLAVFLVGFAIWRSLKKDTVASEYYIKAAFLVITIPLALQAIGDPSGEIYGLILIAEQIGFMLIGASFGLKFLVRWGLWTALAAILFQLRGLGWGFLGLLAVIVIGIAVYRLLKHPPDDPPQ